MKRNQTIPALAATLAIVAPLAGQQRDPMELVRLQGVLRAAMARVAPSTVRVETFGGARRDAVTTSVPLDGIQQPPPTQPAAPAFRYTPKDLEALFERLTPDRLGKLWLEAGQEPKPDDEPFEARDLQKLGEERLKPLFEEFKLGPFKPKPEQPDKPKLPVPSGTLAAQGAATGVVISADGWIVISRYSLAFDPSTILVTLADGRSFRAERHGEDYSRGIALVKIDATDLPVPEFVDAGAVRVGQWAFALGRTFAESATPSVHIGIVSATDRIHGRALQVDAWTSPANYGGPMIDVRGRVLGITVPLAPSGRDAGLDWYDSGIGFAVPLAGLDELLDRLKNDEFVDRGWLGVGLEGADLGPGALISQVVPGSPAASIGLQAGDRIVRIDGIEVRNSFHLQILVGSKMAGDGAGIEFRRGDGPIQAMTAFLATVPVAEREARSRSEDSFELPWEGDPPPEPNGGR